jgi:hypothetical protein
MSSITKIKSELVLVCNLIMIVIKNNYEKLISRSLTVSNQKVVIMNEEIVSRCYCFASRICPTSN